MFPGRLFYAVLAAGSAFLVSPATPLAAQNQSSNVCTEIVADRSRGLAAVEGTADEPERRYALVMGNGVYANGIPGLKNPENDARAVTDTLSQLGFTTFLAVDGQASTIRECAGRLRAALKTGDIALIYYSGHGIQIDDRNYIVAADAAADGDVEKGYVYIDDIIDGAREQASSVLVFLDACRNNPFAPDGAQGLSVSTGRGIDRGLKTVKAAGKPGEKQARGIFVAYSTSPNATATDGDGDLSPFTQAFVKSIATPGYSVQRALSEVSKAVGEATDWEQTPWTKSSLTTEIKLNGETTLQEAVSISDNFAARSNDYLTRGDVGAAIREALKGLPKDVPPDAKVKFPLAYAALEAATRSSSIRLPADAGLDQYNIITIAEGHGRAAIIPMGETVPIALWDTVGRKQIAVIAQTKRMSMVAPAFSRDGKHVAFTDGAGMIGLASASTGLVDHTIDIPGFDREYGQLSSMTFSPSSRFLVTSAQVQEPQAPIRVWSVDSGKPAFELGAAGFASFRKKLNWQAFTGYGNLDEGDRYLSFVLMGRGRSATIIPTLVFGRVEIASGKIVSIGETSFPEAFIQETATAFSPDGRHIIYRYTSASDNIARMILLDAENGTTIGTPVPGYAASFSPDGGSYAVLDGVGVKILSAATGAVEREIPSVTGIEYVAPNPYLDTGEKIGEYQVYDGTLSSYSYDIWWTPPAGKSLLDAARARLGNEATTINGSLAFARTD